MKTGAQLYLDYYKDRYQKGEVTPEQLSSMMAAGALEQEEMDYIMEAEDTGDDRLRELEDFHRTVMAKVKGE